MTSNDTVFILLAGVGATALTDLWALAREYAFKVPKPRYDLVGRWIAHMARGRFRHDAIAAAAPVRGEHATGWITHYAVGVAFAFLLPAVVGAEWIRHPTLLPALLVGVGTVAAPWLLMQPAMGARRKGARLHSLVMHGVFGLGLYAAAMLVGIMMS